MDGATDHPAESNLKESDAPILHADEVLVLELVAKGYAGSKIARLLTMSESTLRRKLRRAQRKLGANSRINAVYLAAKKGLI